MHFQFATGAILGPMDTFGAERKTLHLRMQRHCVKWRKIAEFLNNHQKVKTVYYPGHK
jgi:cystathionine beta-lyase